MIVLHFVNKGEMFPGQNNTSIFFERSKNGRINCSQGIRKITDKPGKVHTIISHFVPTISPCSSNKFFVFLFTYLAFICLAKLNMLFKIKLDESPDYIVIAMDSKKKTFRHELFDDYKANRPKMPEEISYQIPILKEIVEHLGVELIERPGYEADDIMGSLSKIAESNNVTLF